MYLRTAMNGLFKRYNIDRKRVALAGFSDGATNAISLLPLGAIATHIIAWSPGGFAPPLVVSSGATLGHRVLRQHSRHRLQRAAAKAERWLHGLLHLVMHAKRALGSCPLQMPGSI